MEQLPDTNAARIIAAAVQHTGGQRELARYLDVDTVTVWRWATERSLPHPLFVRVCHALVTGIELPMPPQGVPKREHRPALPAITD